MKIVSFHVFEDMSKGISDVFLSHGSLSLDNQIPEKEFEWLEQVPEFEFEQYKQKLFSIIHSPIFAGRYTDTAEMLYVVSKDELDIIDYYTLVQNYMEEFCEFLDQDYTVYFKINSIV